MLTRHRILHYTSPFSGPPTPALRLDTPTDKVYSMSLVHASSRQLLESPPRQPRAVCKTPYRVLDAPDLADNFYLNLVDWSTTNILCVSLGACVYLWTAYDTAVAKLCDLSNVGNTVSSVTWVQKGTLSGRLHIYDAPLSLIGSYNPTYPWCISALSWNADVLSSGSHDRMVHYRDVREAGTHPFRRCAGHKHEVCGPRLGPGFGIHTAGAMLASSGNDNKVCIWDLGGSRCSSASTAIGVSLGTTRTHSGSLSVFADGEDLPLWKFHDRTAAVKALAWDPHVSGVLVSGGGTPDKHIRFWNTYNGRILNQLDTGSQVRDTCRISCPGTHVLYLAMSPEGETIVTGAGDETLRFWNAFPQKENGERKENRLGWARLIR
ncbi:WD40-repeat-containing domain protein [Pisolithus sp. B1]|nr:WD40-repeat-containing domain protein [Pisolithus sp. B1]